jgi:hypothetical protein
MSAQQVKQVKDIHTLLTASVMDFDVEDTDQESCINDHSNLLVKQLMGKNAKSLWFVTNDLNF